VTALNLAERFGTLCARCRRQLSTKVEAEVWRAQEPQRAPVAVVAEIEISRRSVLTVELVPAASHARLQLHRRRADGALKSTPLRVSFHDYQIGDVIAALQQAQRILGAAVPIHEEPTPGDAA
jgi:hypothetical protein